MNKWSCLWVMIAVFSACEPQKGANAMDVTVTSTAFEDGGVIPVRYTADGQDISPPLAFAGIPDGAKSIALICDDPDAPMGTWTHWLIWNIPPQTASLAEDMAPDAELPGGIRQGTSDFGRTGYGGPAPPSGVHRYFFKVYALDAMLDLPAGATKPQLEKAIEGHIVAQGRLMGTYTREK